MDAYRPQGENTDSNIDSLRCQAVHVKATFSPNRAAMLQALRVALSLPRKPIVLKEECTKALAIVSGKSDVCTLTARVLKNAGGEE